MKSRKREARKQAEETLRFNNMILRTQQEASIDGILVVDGAGTVLSFNRRFVYMWGIPPNVMESKSHKRVVEWTLDKLVHPEAAKAIVKHLHEARGKASRAEVALKDGRSFDRYSAPMIEADGKVSRTCLVLQGHHRAQAGRRSGSPERDQVPQALRRGDRRHRHCRP